MILFEVKLFFNSREIKFISLLNLFVCGNGIFIGLGIILILLSSKFILFDCIFFEVIL